MNPVWTAAAPGEEKEEEGDEEDGGEKWAGAFSDSGTGISFTSGRRTTDGTDAVEGEEIEDQDAGEELDRIDALTGRCSGSSRSSGDFTGFRADEISLADPVFACV